MMTLRIEKEADSGLENEDLRPLRDLAEDAVEDSSDLLSSEALDTEAESEEALPEETDESEAESEKVEKASDLVSLYLKEAGSVALLTHEREVELAKQIEEGWEKIKTALFASPFALRHVLELTHNFELGEVPVQEILTQGEEAETIAEIERAGKRLLRALPKLRRLGRSYERLELELRKKRLSARRRENLKRSLKKKTEETIAELTHLQISRSRVDIMAQEIKNLQTRLVGLEQKMRLARNAKEQVSSRRRYSRN